MNKKILSLLALLIIGSLPLQALTKKQVVGRAAILGLAAAAWVSLPGMFVCGEETPSTIPGVAAFAVTTSFFTWFLSHWTAKSRYRWAQKQFDQLERCPLYSIRMDETNVALTLQDAGCEYKDLPLIDAFDRLRSHDRTLRYIEEQLVKAIEDVGCHSELGRKVRKLLKRAAHALDRVRANETFIKAYNKAEWLEQWRVHQKRKLERERMMYQASLVMQPQTHFHGHYVYNRR